MGSKLKHNKLKNTGILFELLVRQITSDIMYNKDSKALGILKKHFNNKSELSKDLVLYKSISNASGLSESKANSYIETILDQASKINTEKLVKEKFNLVKSIRTHYDINEFFKSKIKNYKTLAATYFLLESKRAGTVIDPKEVYSNKNTLVEHLSGIITSENSVEKEFLREDKEIRILAYKILVDKFNNQYSALSQEQKNILKEYINNVSSTIQLKEFINSKILNIKKQLKEVIPTINNKVTQIKVVEINKNLKPLDNKTSVKDEDIVSIMRYYDLIKELKTNE